MAGIYIHIPFCASKCSYCDFYSVANKTRMIDFISALKNEIGQRKSLFNGKEVKTVYFGGGTPSLLNSSQVAEIINYLDISFNIDKNAEISFEANPEDLTKEYLIDLKSFGINRLSIGLQSIDDNTLKLMRRRHDSETAINSVILANSAGFADISIDLIYGIIGLRTNDWEKQITVGLGLPITHLSAYHLGIEQGTLLGRWQKEGKFQKMDENESFLQYVTLVETAEKVGFMQYEISNFAKQGKESKHNSSYWRRDEYLGFGPSAHSLVGNKRIINKAEVRDYIFAVKNNELYSESEMLSPDDILNETIMLELRTSRGLNLEKFKFDFGIGEFVDLEQKIRLLNSKFYFIEDNYLRLTDSGLFVSDDIICTLFK